MHPDTGYLVTLLASRWAGGSPPPQHLRPKEPPPLTLGLSLPGPKPWPTRPRGRLGPEPPHSRASPSSKRPPLSWTGPGWIGPGAQPHLLFPSTCHPLSVCWVFLSFQISEGSGRSSPHPEPQPRLLSGLFHPPVFILCLKKKKSNRSQRPEPPGALAAPHPHSGPSQNREWQTPVSAPPPVSLRLVSGLGPI